MTEGRPDEVMALPAQDTSSKCLVSVNKLIKPLISLWQSGLNRCVLLALARHLTNTGFPAPHCPKCNPKVHGELSEDKQKAKKKIKNTNATSFRPLEHTQHSPEQNYLHRVHADICTWYITKQRALSPACVLCFFVYLPRGTPQEFISETSR